MTRRGFLHLGGAAPGLTALSCAERPAGSEATRLRVSAVPYLSMCPLYLAFETGGFEAEGLEVEIRRNVDYAQRMPLLINGQLDAAFLAVHPGLITAAARGANVRIVLGRDRASASCGDVGAIWGRREVFPDGLDDLTLLKGKRLSMGKKAALGEFYLDIILRSAGMTLDDVIPVKITGPEAVAALIAGQIDAVATSYSEADLAALSADVVRGPSLGDVAPDLQFAYIVFGPSLLEGEREIGVRFLTAYLRGARDFLAGKTPRFLEEIARATNRDPAAARQACRNTFAADGAIDRASLERYIEWAVGKGYCERAVPAESVIDESFLQEANRRLEI